MSRRPAKTRLEQARERMYHDLVFDSAEQVFAQHGFEAATMQQIASEAGISLKTLYAHFEGKSELYREILTTRVREFREAMTAGIDPGASLLDSLATSVHAYVRFLREHTEYLRIHLSESRAWGIGPTEATEEDWLAGVGQLEALVRAGIAQGVFYDDDPPRMARVGVAIMQVWIAELAEDPSEERANQIAEQICVHLRRIFCRPDAPLSQDRDAA